MGGAYTIVGVPYTGTVGVTYMSVGVRLYSSASVWCRCPGLRQRFHVSVHEERFPREPLDAVNIRRVLDYGSKGALAFGQQRHDP